MSGSLNSLLATPLLVLIPLVYVAIVAVVVWGLLRLAGAAERIAAALETLVHRPEQR